MKKLYTLVISWLSSLLIRRMFALKLTVVIYLFIFLIIQPY